MWALGTATVLVLLFSYHTSTSSRFAPTQAAVAARERAGSLPDLPESGTFDGDGTMVLGDRVSKTLVWFDNGWGYAHRAVDLIQRLGLLDREAAA